MKMFVNGQKNDTSPKTIRIWHTDISKNRRQRILCE